MWEGDGDLMCNGVIADWLPYFLGAIRAMNAILLDTMFDLPSLEGIEEVITDRFSN